MLIKQISNYVTFLKIQGGKNPFKCQHNTCIQLNPYSNEIIFLYIHFKEQLIYMFLLELRVK